MKQARDLEGEALRIAAAARAAERRERAEKGWTLATAARRTGISSRIWWDAVRSGVVRGGPDWVYREDVMRAEGDDEFRAHVEGAELLRSDQVGELLGVSSDVARDLVHSGLVPVAATLRWRYGRVVRLVRRGDVVAAPAERLIAQVTAYRRLRRQGEHVPRLETPPDMT